MKVMKIAISLTTAFCAFSAYAFDGSDGSSEPQRNTSALKMAIQEVVDDREFVIEQILNSPALPAKGPMSDRSELEQSLRGLSDSGLAKALLSSDLADMKNAVFGAPDTPSGFDDDVNLIGGVGGEYVFHPIAPCRIFDTRSDARGEMIGGETREFAVQGTLISNQGGHISDCPDIPFDPPGVVMTLTIANPQGGGFARAWAYDSPTPSASSINYRPNVNIANTTIVPVCINCGSQNDILVSISAATAQVIGDIVGYFERPEGCPAGTVEISAKCVDTSLRTAASVFSASNTCENLGGRLLTPAETLLAVDILAGVAGGEHTGGIYEISDAGAFRNLRITNGGSLISDVTLEPAPFRCARDLFGF